MSVGRKKLSVCRENVAAFSCSGIVCFNQIDRNESPVSKYPLGTNERANCSLSLVRCFNVGDRKRRLVIRKVYTISSTEIVVLEFRVSFIA